MPLTLKVHHSFLLNKCSKVFEMCHKIVENYLKDIQQRFDCIYIYLLR